MGDQGNGPPAFDEKPAAVAEAGLNGTGNTNEGNGNGNGSGCESAIVIENGSGSNGAANAGLENGNENDLNIDDSVGGEEQNNGIVLDGNGAGEMSTGHHLDTACSDGGPSSLLGVGPPSPLTGCYLLIVLGEPHSDEHKDIILQRLMKGFLSWDIADCHVDLEEELNTITQHAPEGEEARHGERLIQYASENLVTEILIHPQYNTLIQCMRNLLSSFTRHRHIIHAGYTFSGNGSWILQDATFSVSDFSEAFQEHDVQRVLRAYPDTITMNIHCADAGLWNVLPDKPYARSCKIRINPVDVLNTGSDKINAFIDYLAPMLIPADLQELLETSDVVGNIRFSHPTLYVFPGGQGDAALFGINGFNMLVDGGFNRKACFWDFARHLDRLDAVLMTRINNSNIMGLSAVVNRKQAGNVYPQIGHYFCNIPERKGLPSPDGDKDKDPLLVDLFERGHHLVSNLRALNLKPQNCYRDMEPINLYHKVGHGTLDMYVISPARDSKEVKEFLQKWASGDHKLFAAKDSKEFNFPVQNLVSICALLVWQPANPEDTITRILFPGSTPDYKIIDGLDKIKHLEFMKHPICTAKTIAPAITTAMTKKALKAAPVEKGFPEPVFPSKAARPQLSAAHEKDNKILESKLKSTPQQLDNRMKEASVEALPPKSAITTKTEIRSDPLIEKVRESEENMIADNKEIDSIDHKSQEIEQQIDNKEAFEQEISKRVELEIIKKDSDVAKEEIDVKVKSAKLKADKPRAEVKPVVRSRIDTKPPKSMDKKIIKKDIDKKASPTATPRKQEQTKPVPKEREIKAKITSKITKSSPSSTPAKSTKDANNRKVLESKQRTKPTKREIVKKETEKKEAKPERKPISRRPRGTSPSKRAPGSPVKAAKPKADARKSRLDKEGTTDSSLVSTPSADEVTAAKKISDIATPQDMDVVKQRELDDLKEEQEVVREIEAVFSRDEKKRQIDDEDEQREVIDIVKQDSTTEVEDEEEYLIIEKEEVEQYTEDSINEPESSVTKEEEMQKHQRDSQESEKKRKPSAEEEIEKQVAKLEADEKLDKDESSEKFEKEEVEQDAKEDQPEDIQPDSIEEPIKITTPEKQELKAEVQDIIASAKEVAKAKTEESAAKTEEFSSPTPEDKVSSAKKTSDTKDELEVQKEVNLQESLPEEKFSATIESGATTAPTLPEDERIPLDEIKEDLIIEEKYVKEETKETEVPTSPPKPTNIDPVASTRVFPAKMHFDAHQGLLRDVIKTPDEVADLPVHEEADFVPYEELGVESKKKPSTSDNKDEVSEKDVLKEETVKEDKELAEDDEKENEEQIDEKKEVDLPIQKGELQAKAQLDNKPESPETQSPEKEKLVLNIDSSPVKATSPEKVLTNDTIASSEQITSPTKAMEILPEKLSPPNIQEAVTEVVREVSPIEPMPTEKATLLEKQTSLDKSTSPEKASFDQIMPCQKASTPEKTTSPEKFAINEKETIQEQVPESEGAISTEKVQSPKIDSPPEKDSSALKSTSLEKMASPEKVFTDDQSILSEGIASPKKDLSSSKNVSQVTVLTTEKVASPEKIISPDKPTSPSFEVAVSPKKTAAEPKSILSEKITSPENDVPEKVASLEKLTSPEIVESPEKTAPKEDATPEKAVSPKQSEIFENLSPPQKSPSSEDSVKPKEGMYSETTSPTKHQSLEKALSPVPLQKEKETIPEKPASLDAPLCETAPGSEKIQTQDKSPAMDIKSPGKIASPESIKSPEKIPSPEETESLEKISSPKIETPEKTTSPEKAEFFEKVVAPVKPLVSNNISEVEKKHALEEESSFDKAHTLEKIIASEACEAIATPEKVKSPEKSSTMEKAESLVQTTPVQEDMDKTHLPAMVPTPEKESTSVKITSVEKYILPEQVESEVNSSQNTAISPENIEAVKSTLPQIPASPEKEAVELKTTVSSQKPSSTEKSSELLHEEAVTTQKVPSPVEVPLHHEIIQHTEYSTQSEAIKSPEKGSSKEASPVQVKSPEATKPSSPLKAASPERVAHEAISPEIISLAEKTTPATENVHQKIVPSVKTESPETLIPEKSQSVDGTASPDQALPIEETMQKPSDKGISPENDVLPKQSAEMVLSPGATVIPESITSAQSNDDPEKHDVSSKKSSMTSPEVDTSSEKDILQEVADSVLPTILPAVSDKLASPEKNLSEEPVKMSEEHNLRKIDLRTDESKHLETCETPIAAASPEKSDKVEKDKSLEDTSLVTTFKDVSAEQVTMTENIMKDKVLSDEKISESSKPISPKEKLDEKPISPVKSSPLENDSFEGITELSEKTTAVPEKITSTDKDVALEEIAQSDPIAPEKRSSPLPDAVLQGSPVVISPKKTSPISEKLVSPEKSIPDKSLVIDLDKDQVSPKKTQHHGIISESSSSGPMTSQEIGPEKISSEQTKSETISHEQNRAKSPISDNKMETATSPEKSKSVEKEKVPHEEIFSGKHEVTETCPEKPITPQKVETLAEDKSIGQPVIPSPEKPSSSQKVAAADVSLPARPPDVTEDELVNIEKDENIQVIPCIDQKTETKEVSLPVQKDQISSSEEVKSFILEEIKAKIEPETKTSIPDIAHTASETKVPDILSRKESLKADEKEKDEVSPKEDSKMITATYVTHDMRTPPTPPSPGIPKKEVNAEIIKEIENQIVEKVTVPEKVAVPSKLEDQVKVSEDTKGEIKDALKTVVGTLEDMSDKSVKNAEGLAAEIEDKSKQLTDKVQLEIEETADLVKGEIQSLADKLTEKASKATDDTTNLVDQSKQAIEASIDQLASKIEKHGKEVDDKITTTVEKAEKKTKDIEKKLENVEQLVSDKLVETEDTIEAVVQLAADGVRTTEDMVTEKAASISATIEKTAKVVESGISSLFSDLSKGLVTAIDSAADTLADKLQPAVAEEPIDKKHVPGLTETVPPEKKSSYEITSFTTELRETHITTLDSPIKEDSFASDDFKISGLERDESSLHDIREEDEDDRYSPPNKDIIYSGEKSPVPGARPVSPREEEVAKIVTTVAEVLKSEKELTEIIPDFDEKELEEKLSRTSSLKDSEGVTVQRMLVTASSEDGGEEIEICPAGTIKFTPGSTPEPSSGKISPENGKAESDDNDKDEQQSKTPESSKSSMFPSHSDEKTSHFPEETTMKAEPVPYDHKVIHAYELADLEEFRHTDGSSRKESISVDSSIEVRRESSISISEKDITKDESSIEDHSNIQLTPEHKCSEAVKVDKTHSHDSKIDTKTLELDKVTSEIIVESQLYDKDETQKNIVAIDEQPSQRDSLSSPPESAASKPESVSGQPESETSRRESVSSGRESVASKPESEASKPESVASRPGSALSPSELAIIKPESAVSPSESVTSGHELTTSRPESADSKPDSIESRRESATSPPVSAASKPDSVASQPDETVTSRRESTSSRPESEASKPESAASRPGSALSQSELAIIKPDSAVSPSESVTSGHELTTSRPESADSKPDSIESRRESATSQPVSAASKPESVASQPDEIVTSRRESTSSRPESEASKPESAASRPGSALSPSELAIIKPDSAVSPSESVTSGHESTTSRPESADSKPDSIESRRESATSQPVSAASKPESVASQPDEIVTSRRESTSSRPESVVSKPESAASRPGSALSPSELAIIKPDSAVSPSESVTSGHESTTSRPESADSKPDSIESRRESATSQPVSAATKPESVASQPDEIVTSRRESTSSRPESVVSKPESAASRPGSALSPSELAIIKPDSAVSPSESVTSGHESTTSRPESADSKPDSIESRRESATSQPVSAASKPESVASQPDEIVTSRRESTSSRPESVVSKPESAASRPGSALSPSELAIIKPESAVSPSESVTSGHELTTSRPESADSKPDSIESRRESATSQPVSAATKPESVASQPDEIVTSRRESTSSRPESEASKPESAASRPGSALSPSELAIIKPESAVSPSESVTSGHELTTSRPESADSKPDSIESRRESATSQPVSAASKPESVASQPDEIVTSRRESTSSRPESVVSKPELAASRPGSALSPSELAIIKPDSAVSPSESVTSGHELTTSRPESADSKPDSIESRRESATSQPVSAATKPESVASQPDEIVTSRRESTSSRPESEASKPESIASRPDSALSSSELAIIKPDSTISPSESVAIQSESISSRPESAASKSVTSRRESTSSQPESVTIKTDLVESHAGTLTSQRESKLSTPESAASKPDSIETRRDSATSQPESEPSKPDSVTSQISESVTSRRESTSSRPESVASKPEVVASRRDSASSQPESDTVKPATASPSDLLASRRESASSRPESAASKPESASSRKQSTTSQHESVPSKPSSIAGSRPESVLSTVDDKSFASEACSSRPQSVASHHEENDYTKEKSRPGSIQPDQDELESLNGLDKTGAIKSSETSRKVSPVTSVGKKEDIGSVPSQFKETEEGRSDSKSPDGKVSPKPSSDTSLDSHSMSASVVTDKISPELPVSISESKKADVSPKDVKALETSPIQSTQQFLRGSISDQGKPTLETPTVIEEAVRKASIVAITAAPSAANLVEGDESIKKSSASSSKESSRPHSVISEIDESIASEEILAKQLLKASSIHENLPSMTESTVTTTTPKEKVKGSKSDDSRPESHASLVDEKFIKSLSPSETQELASGSRPESVASHHSELACGAEASRPQSVTSVIQSRRESEVVDEKPTSPSSDSFIKETSKPDSDASRPESNASERPISALSHANESKQQSRPDSAASETASRDISRPESKLSQSEEKAIPDQYIVDVEQMETQDKSTIGSITSQKSTSLPCETEGKHTEVKKLPCSDQPKDQSKPELSKRADSKQGTESKADQDDIEKDEHSRTDSVSSSSEKDTTKSELSQEIIMSTGTQHIKETLTKVEIKTSTALQGTTTDNSKLLEAKKSDSKAELISEIVKDTDDSRRESILSQSSDRTHHSRPASSMSDHEDDEDAEIMAIKEARSKSVASIMMTSIYRPSDDFSTFATLDEECSETSGQQKVEISKENKSVERRISISPECDVSRKLSEDRIAIITSSTGAVSPESSDRKTPPTVPVSPNIKSEFKLSQPEATVSQTTQPSVTKETSITSGTSTPKDVSGKSSPGFQSHTTSESQSIPTPAGLGSSSPDSSPKPTSPFPRVTKDDLKSFSEQSTPDITRIPTPEMTDPRISPGSSSEQVTTTTVTTITKIISSDGKETVTEQKTVTTCDSTDPKSSTTVVTKTESISGGKQIPCVKELDTLKSEHRSSTPGSDDFEQHEVSSIRSDTSVDQVSRVTSGWTTGTVDDRHFSDDEVPPSPLSTTSDAAFSPPSDYSYEYHMRMKQLKGKKSDLDIEIDSQDDIPPQYGSIEAETALPVTMTHKTDPMSTSFYGALPETFGEKSSPIPIKSTVTRTYQESTSSQSGDSFSQLSFQSKQGDHKFLDEADLDFEKALEEHRLARGDEVMTTVTSKYSYSPSKQASGTEAFAKSQFPLENVQKVAKTSTSSVDSVKEPDSDKPQDGKSEQKDPAEVWGKPLGLPSPAPMPAENDVRTTPKKERKLMLSKTKVNNEKNLRKRSESPVKAAKKTSPIYMDLTYVPHNGNSYYSHVEFFKRVRARYYVFSGTEPSREVYNALLEAKQTWEDKDLEVTIIPTYDTDVLGYWVSENEELLAKHHIDLSPSASRCTINLQDHETSCSAYRLEF